MIIHGGKMMLKTQHQQRRTCSSVRLLESACIEDVMLFHSISNFNNTTLVRSCSWQLGTHMYVYVLNMHVYTY